QFASTDEMVYRRPGDAPTSFGGIRTAAMERAEPPAEGGDEEDYLAVFLEVRRKAMNTLHPTHDTSRVSAQRHFLDDGNLGLDTPLEREMYGTPYKVA